MRKEGRPVASGISAATGLTNQPRRQHRPPHGAVPRRHRGHSAAQPEHRVLPADLDADPRVDVHARLVRKGIGHDRKAYTSPHIVRHDSGQLVVQRLLHLSRAREDLHDPRRPSVTFGQLFPSDERAYYCHFPVSGGELVREPGDSGLGLPTVPGRHRNARPLILGREQPPGQPVRVD